MDPKPSPHSQTESDGLAPLQGIELTESRRAIVDRLQQLEWFQASEPDIQLELVTLPQQGKENHDGFLEDLASRPELIANVKVNRLVELPRGNFALIPVFEVSNGNDVYTYEYVSWRYGPDSGVKGLVFLKDDDRVTHFVAMRGEKFATGNAVHDTVGGFIDFSVEGVQTAIDRIRVELKQELQVDDITILDEPVLLGHHQVDAGMTNNCPELFAAFIDAGEAEKFGSAPDQVDNLELEMGVKIIPIERLRQAVIDIDDSYFRSTVALLWAKGIIPLK